MPDAHRAVRPHGLVERLLGRQMRCRLVLRISQQLIHRAPVLNHDRGPREPHFRMNKSQLGLTGEFLQHSRHGASDWPPFVNLQGFVDSQADQKDDEIAVKAGGDALVSDHGVVGSRIGIDAKAPPIPSRQR